MLTAATLVSSPIPRCANQFLFICKKHTKNRLYLRDRATSLFAARALGIICTAQLNEGTILRCPPENSTRSNIISQHCKT